MSAYSVTARPRKSSKRFIRLDINRRELVLSKVTVMRLGCIPIFTRDKRRIPLEDVRWVAWYDGHSGSTLFGITTYAVAIRGGVFFVPARWHLADHLLLNLEQALACDGAIPFWHRGDVQIWFYRMIPLVIVAGVGAAALAIMWYWP